MPACAWNAKGAYARCVSFPAAAALSSGRCVMGDARRPPVSHRGKAEKMLRDIAELYVYLDPPPELLVQMAIAHAILALGRA